VQSDFVRQQIDELLHAFGEPVKDLGLTVSRVSDQFKNNTATDIRPNHALAAARHYRLRETWLISGAPSTPPYQFTVGRADITNTAAPHSMVTIVTTQPGKDPVVDSAWRVPLATDEETPTAALLGVVERAGMEVSFGGVSDRFIPNARSQGDAQVRAQTVPGHRYTVSALVRRDPVDGVWLGSWIYAIDLDVHDAQLG
jgi:hypothetical protein